MVARSCNFRELDFKKNAREFECQPELKFEAGIAWVESNNEERRYAEDLLLKEDLPLLSDDVKEYIIVR